MFGFQQFQDPETSSGRRILGVQEDGFGVQEDGLRVQGDVLVEMLEWGLMIDCLIEKCDY